MCYGRPGLPLALCTVSSRAVTVTATLFELRAAAVRPGLRARRPGTRTRSHSVTELAAAGPARARPDSTEFGHAASGTGPAGPGRVIRG